MKEKWGEKFIAKGHEEDGLLVVDLLTLRKKFSWARYQIDIIGFLAAALIALLLILLALFLAGLEA